MRELKIGDRVVDWKDEAGAVLETDGFVFDLRYDMGEEVRGYGWVEFGSNGQDDIDAPVGTFRFEDTEYPEWPR